MNSGGYQSRNILKVGPIHCFYSWFPIKHFVSLFSREMVDREKDQQSIFNAVFSPFFRILLYSIGPTFATIY